MPDLQREGGVRFLLIADKLRVGAGEMQRREEGAETRRQEEERLSLLLDRRGKRAGQEQVGRLGGSCSAPSLAATANAPARKEQGSAANEAVRARVPSDRWHVMSHLAQEQPRAGNYTSQLFAVGVHR